MNRLRKTFAPALLALAWSAACPAPAAETELSSVESIRLLPPEQISAGRPVRLSGKTTTITREGCYIHAGGRCILVDWDEAVRRKIWTLPRPRGEDFQRGQLAQITGITAPGRFSPKILPSGFERSATEALSEPRVVATDRLLSGNADGQWIELEGVIQEFIATGIGNEAILLLITEGHACRISMWNATGIKAEDCVDAQVTVRGIFSPLVNLRQEMNGLGLFISDRTDIRIRRPPPENPFGARRVALGNLLTFSPQDFQPWNRRVTSGIVSFARPGEFFFMQDGKSGIRVYSTSTIPSPGRRIEVSGFVSRANTLAELDGALVRELESVPLPEPIDVTCEELMRPRLRDPATGESSADFHGRRIRLRGRLVRDEMDVTSGMRVLIIESEGFSFPARLTDAGPVRPHWPLGSELEFTGTCDLHVGESTLLGRAASITGFDVWLSSTADVRLTHRPPWLTPARMWLLVGSIAGVLGLALIWVHLLRREVTIRGEHLAAEITSRNEAALRFETTLAERNALAADLHDTLEQSLVGLSLQIQAARYFFNSDATRAGKHLELAESFLDRSREEMRRTVARLRYSGDAVMDLEQSIRESVEPILKGAGLSLVIASEGTIIHPTVLIGNHLLMLAQEAITNAVKHARATSVRISIHHQSERIELAIEDDGLGFKPTEAPGPAQGNYGLQGMRERARRIQARLDITSSPGQGCRIFISAPRCPQARAEEPASHSGGGIMS